MVEVAPHHRHGDQGGHHGQEQDGPEDGATAQQPGVHGERGRQRHGDRRRPGDRHEPDRVAERGPEARIVDQPRIVGHTDHAQAARIGDGVDVEVGEGQEERRRGRQDEEQGDQAERGRDEEDQRAPRASSAAHERRFENEP